MTDKDKLEKAVKLANAMYYAAQSLTTDASRLHKAMEDYHQFIIYDYRKEEPSSEDFEQAAESAVLSVFTGYADTNTPLRAEKIALVSRIFKAGSQWQMKELMKNAIEGGCFSYKNGYVHISCDIDEHLTDIKVGDRVKVIIIKE